MDFQLTHFYRQVCEDALLIIDVIRINPSLKPVKESWLECFTEGAWLNKAINRILAKTLLNVYFHDG